MSIIGNPIMAGAKPKASINVTAKAGALLNLHYKDSSIILNSYQLGAEETQHTFVVSVSETTYVVEDVTNGKSVEVLVDVAAWYSVEIEYVRHLYNLGNNKGELIARLAANAKVDFEEAYIHCYYSQSSQGHSLIVTNNTVDITGYSKLKIRLNHVSEITSSMPTFFGIKNTNIMDDWYTFVSYVECRTIGEDVVFELDVSQYSGNYYIGYANIGVCYIKEIWLE